MKNKYILLMLGLAVLTGCKNLTCDFSYTPTAPKAGETVTFTNHSSGADDYSWDFGDNTSATSSSPYHAYKKPGTYIITLKVVRNKVQHKSCSHAITVYDSLPGIGCDTAAIVYYTPATYTAQVWNPWGHEVKYRWEVDDAAVITQGAGLDSAALTCYYTRHSFSPTVRLTVTLNGVEQPVATLTREVEDKPGKAILMINDGKAQRQRRYTIDNIALYEQPNNLTYDEGFELLNAEQDTMQIYLDTVFYCKTLPIQGYTVQGFHIDPLARKIYFRAGGLYIANIDGTNIVCIDSSDTYAMTLNTIGKRVYWSNAEGLWTMPFISTYDNRIANEPMLVNSNNNITKLAVDNTER